MQYSVTRGGTVLLVLNRFVYSMAYRYRDQSRRWRCVNRYRKCPAEVVTRGGLVLRRMFGHIHPFHDKKIMKMVRSGSILGVDPDALRGVPAEPGLVRGIPGLRPTTDQADFK